MLDCFDFLNDAYARRLFSHVFSCYLKFYICSPLVSFHLAEGSVWRVNYILYSFARSRNFYDTAGNKGNKFYVAVNPADNDTINYIEFNIFISLGLISDGPPHAQEIYH